MPKVRLDVLLVERGLVESRSMAQRLVMAGQVRINGQVIIKPATGLEPDVTIEIENRPRFVSRGGEKLEAALHAFKVQVTNRVCADVGASTGGFTDCLIQHGAARVFAIDVGEGILDWKLRQDPRITVMEGTNARFLNRLPEPVSLVTIDVSFISLKILIPVVKSWFMPSLTSLCNNGIGSENRTDLIKGDVIALIKPQFEAGRQVAARGKGVIHDPLVHRQVLLDVLTFAQQTGYGLQGLIRSPLLGPKGNAEFLAYLVMPEMSSSSLDILVTSVTGVN